MATSAGELIYTVGMDISGAVNNGNRASQAFNGLERSASTLNTTLSRTYSIAMSVAGALAVDRIIKYADAWTIAGNKITNYLKDGQNLVDVQNAIFNAAQDTRTPLAAVASLYARLEPATRGIVTSGEEMIKITETINKAFVVSGATGEEAASAIVQLGQALGSGALRSEEFNSVNEQAPRIMQGIADSLGVTRGELKGLAAQGKLTTEVVINAIRGMASSVDVEFAKMNQTFEQKGIVALNNLTKSLGTNADVQKAVAKIGDAMVSLSENIDTAVVAGEALAVVYGAKLVGAMANSTAAMVKNAVANHAASIASVESAEKALAQATAEKVRAEAERFSAVTTVGLTEAKLASVRAASLQVTSEISVAKANENSIRVQMSQIASEKALEVQRLKAQISETGRIMTSTRMAEIRQAEIALNAKLAAAQAETSAAISAATAREIAITNELTAAKSTLRLATLSVTQATAAQAAAQTALTATSRAASVAVGVMNGALALVGGPAGLATIAAIGVYMLYQNMEEGRKASIEYGKSLDVSTEALKKLTAAQAAAQAAQLERSIVNQQNEVSALKKEVSDLSEEYERNAKTSMALFGSVDGLRQQQQDLAIATADLEAKEAELSQTKDKLYSIQQQQNGQLRDNYVLMGDVNQRTGIAAGIQNELNNILGAGNRILAARNKAVSQYVAIPDKKVSQGAQKILDDLKARTEAEKAYGTAQSARIMAEKEAMDAGVTDPKEIQMISDAAAALFEQTKNRKDDTKSANEHARAVKADNTASEQNAQTINDAKLKTQQLTIELSNLKNGTEEITGATSRYSIESATLAAQQQLNKDATKQQVAALAEQILAQQRVNEEIAKGKREQENRKKVTTEFETVESSTFTAGESVDAKYQADLKALKDYHKLAGAENSRYEKAKSRLEKQYEKDKRQAMEDDYKAQSEGHAFVMDSLDALGNASTNAISGLLSGTMSVTEAMQSFANIILNQAVGALVEMGIEQVKNQMLSTALAQTQQANIATTTTASIAAGQANAAAQSAAAGSVAAASMPAAAATATWSFGQAAVIGGVALAGTFALAKMLGGRQFGGPTDAGMYRVGENNQPEIYQSGGASYLISGDRGRVTPMSEVGSGGGFQQSVSVHNYGNSQVSTRTSPDGKQMDVIINEISSQLEQRRGRFARAMTSGTNTKFKAR